MISRRRVWSWPFPAASTAVSSPALCVRALGPERVLGPAHARAGLLGRNVAVKPGPGASIWASNFVHEDITPHPGCRRLLSASGRGDPAGRARLRSRLEIQNRSANGADADAYRLFSMVVESPAGRTAEARAGHCSLPRHRRRHATSSSACRKMLEYYHADRLNYAVAGTPNRLEYDQGFFVKLGDGAADMKPIAHLYKTQVYQMARVSGSAGSHLQPAAHHRHLLAAAVPGGILFLPALSKAGPGPVWQGPGDCAGRNRRGGWVYRRAGEPRLPGHRRQAARGRLSARAAVLIGNSSQMPRCCGASRPLRQDVLPFSLRSRFVPLPHFSADTGYVWHRRHIEPYIEPAPAEELLVAGCWP